MRRVNAIIAAAVLLTAPPSVAEDKPDDAPEKSQKRSEKKSEKAGDGKDEKEEDLLVSPTARELNDADKKSLKATLDTGLVKVIESCVAEYPRPEFFTTLAVQFELRKSGDLRGGYVSSGAVDSNLYVKSDEERAKMEAEGSFTRMVVRNDRDLERCLQKGTREFESELSRVSGRVVASYDVKWKGKKAKLNATSFEVSK